MAGVGVLNAAGVSADVPPGTGSGDLAAQPDETLGYPPARSQLVFFTAVLPGDLPAQVRYVPAATFAGGPPTMTATGDTPSTVATSAASATTAQA